MIKNTNNANNINNEDVVHFHTDNSTPNSVSSTPTNGIPAALANLNNNSLINSNTTQIDGISSALANLNLNNNSSVNSNTMPPATPPKIMFGFQLSTNTSPNKNDDTDISNQDFSFDHVYSANSMSENDGKYPLVGGYDPFDTKEEFDAAHEVMKKWVAQEQQKNNPVYAKNKP